MNGIEFLIAGLLLGGSLLVFSKQAGASFSPFKAVQSEHDQGDLDTLARTIWGEARGEGELGMRAVANVIMNRYAQAKKSQGKARQFGASVEAICQKPFQFSVWNVGDPNFSKMVSVTPENKEFRLALDIAEKALKGSLKDITSGADHYHTAAVNPSWSRGKTPVQIINSHQFYKLT